MLSRNVCVQFAVHFDVLFNLWFFQNLSLLFQSKTIPGGSTSIQGITKVFKRHALDSITILIAIINYIINIYLRVLKGHLKSIAYISLWILTFKLFTTLGDTSSGDHE